MAKVYVSFGRVMGGGAPVYAPTPSSSSPAITSSATSQQASIIAGDGDYATVFATGGAVRIAFGPTPTAVANSGRVIGDGQSIDLGPLKNGDKIAIIDSD